MKCYNLFIFNRTNVVLFHAKDWTVIHVFMYSVCEIERCEKNICYSNTLPVEICISNVNVNNFYIQVFFKEQNFTENDRLFYPYN